MPARLRIAWLVAALLLVADPALCVATANSASCNQSIPDGAGYTILRVTPNVRWGGALDAGLPVKPGDVYSQANVSLAQDYVVDQMKRQESATLALLARASARYVSSCTLVEAAADCQKALHTDKCVTIRVDVFAVQIPAADVATLNPGQSKAPTDTYLDGVPGALLALSPKAGIGTDSALGTTVRLNTATNLRDLGELVGLFRQSKPSSRAVTTRYRGTISVTGFRGLDSPYYSGELDFRGTVGFHGFVKELGAEVSYSADFRPLGDGTLRANVLKAGVSAVVSVGQPVVHSLLVRGSYNHGANALDAATSSATQTERGLHEDGLLAQVATEGTLKAATIRSSLWFQRDTALAGESYRKLVVRAGLARGIAVRSHQTIDFEVLGGYGRTSGLVPAEDRFTGGNSGAGFMDDGLRSTAQAVLPTGPIVRSYGAGRLDWIGASATSTSSDQSQSFSHINLTASIPIGISRPLIPVFEVFDGKTVADVLKARVDKDNLLKASLKLQGYSDKAAQKEQDRVMNAVRPAVHFIADQANVWSVKPVVFFDWARTDGTARPAQDWTAAGGGVQFGLVTAQLRAGYIHSVGNGGGPGNFIFRLTFQNLF